MADNTNFEDNIKDSKTMEDQTVVTSIEKNRGPVSNADLVEGAGQVHMDEAQGWGTGIIKDFKRTVGTHWVKEVTNFNQKTIAVTLLMFISVIAPTLTFEAVYGKESGNRIGAVETILATTWVGVAYSMIGGMPMVSSAVQPSVGTIDSLFSYNPRNAFH